ncbi:hypothetical protein [Deinococcus sp. QL22]|uniref:hypothetical protein n=1 Tax=Deinococcus sp. QL22 TaxID=2939437 RepID=UPI002016E97D|nr:hypothetical protein [Deinococcus sp. QL22]UQN09590.1 hypothetical protein M1R55_25935 [Deinococcus sp. QL22]
MSNPISSRRSLLKAFAAVLPLAVTGTAGAQMQAIRPLARPLRVALVAPASGSPVALTGPFVHGLTPVLRRAGIELSLHLTGPRTKQIVQAAHTALAQRPDALIALGDGLARLMQPALETATLPVIAAEVGARMPDAERPLPLSLSASLQAWEAEWMHGALLGQQGAPVHLFISVLESGYDLPFAFSAGLTSVRGHLTGTTILNGQSAAGAARAAQQSGAAHVHLLASEWAGAADFVQSCTRLGLGVSVGGLTAGSPRRALSLPDAASAGALSAAKELGQTGWKQGLHAAPTHALTALGYDIGLWISAAAQPLTQFTAQALFGSLASVQVAGVRGLLSVNSAGQLRAPLRLQEASGRQSVLDGVPTMHPLLVAHRTGLRSGWIQPYLHG